MYIVVSFLFICVQVYGPLPPGDNPIAVNIYHIISYYIIPRIYNSPFAADKLHNTLHVSSTVAP
jgi:hypothetical protein